MRLLLGMVWGSFAFFFCLSVYCHVTLLCSLWYPVLGVKIYRFSWRLLLFFCLDLANILCHLFTHRCTLSWYFNDVKYIVLSFRPYPTIPHPLISSSGCLSLTFDSSLVPNVCIGNKEQGFNISHFTIHICFNII